jgi:MYXO-CTERM domain-containing protein
MAREAIVLGLAALLAGGVFSGVGCGRSSDTNDAPVTGGGTGGEGGGEPTVITDFEACAETSQEATLVPVNMLLMVDTSGSMADDGKWDATSAAFTTFFQDASSSSLQVALRFWPEGQCDDMACDVDACATPTVAVGPLTDGGHRQDLIDAFAAVVPEGPTPMSAALEGAAQWARARQMDVGNSEQVVIVLVTDGEPNGCNEAIGAISGVAGDAFTMDGIPTFAVGIEGSLEADMNAIATAGGTDAGFFIGAANAETELLAALQEIAGKSVDCSFPVPEATDPGSVLDPRLVRVEYTPQGQSASDLIDKTDGADDCGQGGWYYDDPVAPTTITLCPSTCSEVQSDEEAQLAIALGCECEQDDDCPESTVCEENKCVDACFTDADCPGDFICLSGHCVPPPGDPCQVDADCPLGMVCVGDQCSLSGIFVGAEEAVQGGAFNCATGRNGPDQAWWLFGLGLAAFVTRRRPRRRA